MVVAVSGAIVLAVAVGGLTMVWPLLLAAAGFALLASVGGVLWCLTRLTLPHLPPEPAGTRRPARFWLRVLAEVQIGAGVILAVAAAVYASDHLLVRPRHIGSPIYALEVLFVAIGLAGQGAILWCAVRVAYPDRPAGLPPSAELSETPPVRGQVVWGFLHALAAVVTTAATALMVGLTLGGLVVSVVVGLRSLLTILIAAAAVATLMAVLGGILWCLHSLVVAPPPAGPSRRRRLTRAWLQSLAGIQVGLGAYLTVAAAVNTAGHLRVQPWLQSERTLLAAGMVAGGIGLASLGGVLWCAVRVAYPNEQTVAK
jgi:hypothetical protein